jgi:hypothetical protein
MKSYPSSQQVLEDLGDKVVDGLALAFARTRTDLREYRSDRPHFAATSSERGLANWIHDRYWSHLAGLLGDAPDVIVVDKEPLREVCVGVRYRIRIKRHQQDGSVSTYPTQTALEFLTQDGQTALSGLEEVKLVGGYSWNRDSRDLVAPVISLRDGADKVIWSVELPTAGDEEGGARVVRPEDPSPKQPTISLPTAALDDEEKDVPE